MSEPIYLYDKHGERKPYYSPSEAHAQVVAGLLFVDPPIKTILATDTVTVTFDSPEAKEAWAQKAANMEPLEVTGPPLPPLTPDDTQEVPVVPVVPTGKARRKSSGNSGVL